MCLDRLSVMRANLYVYPNYSAIAHSLTKTRIEHQRTSMRNTGLYNHVRLDSIDNFLKANHIVGKLDDGPSHPGETVNVFGVPSAA